MKTQPEFRYVITMTVHSENTRDKSPIATRMVQGSTVNEVVEKFLAEVKYVKEKE